MALNEGCLGGDRKEYTVNSLDIFDLPAEGVTCALGGPHKIRVWFRNPSPEEIKDGNPKSAAFCGAQGTWAPNAKVASMLADGAAGRLPPDHQIPKDELDLFLKDQRTLRETRCLPLSYLPAPAQSCLNQVHQELDESIRRAVKLMRWRFALPGSHNPFSARVQAERFTLDGAEWHSVPSNLQLSIVGLSSFRLTETHRRTLGELLEGAAEEPLGHELLREAVTVRDTAPRSALLIGVSALEVGVKELIGKLAPSAAWMAENLPSPPS